MKFLVILSLLFSTTVFSATKTNWKPKYEKKKLQELKKKIKPVVAKKEDKKSKYKAENPLEALYLKKSKNRHFLKKLRVETLKMKQKAVPTLIKVMKSSHFPDENKWVATYMLGKIMGKKSAEFISKFAKHPNWMMRLASLKVLLHLEQKQFLGLYANLLEDNSLIVRHQALQNVRELKLKKLAPFVWKMLYNKKNYVGTAGSRKRANIIKDAIRVVGELGLEKAKKPMLTMLTKTKYKDIHAELDYSLSKLYRKKSPDGGMGIKMNYWKKIALSETKI